MKVQNAHCRCRRARCGACGGAASNVHDRSAGRLVDPARRRAEGHVGEGVPGLSITQTPGAGIANVRGIDEGKAQIGLANSNTTVDGIDGRPPYPKKVTKVCQLANLYPQYFQVVALANAGVNSYADLKGKSVVAQPKGNTAEIMTDMILKANGSTISRLPASVPGLVHRRGVDDEGRPCARHDARHHRARLGGHGPRQRARRQARARGRKDVRLRQEGERGHNKLTIKAGTYPKQDRTCR